MAEVWRVDQGERPTIGLPWVRLPLSEVVTLFDMQQDDFVSDLGAAPRVGAADRDLTYAGFKHVVVEVEHNEARQTNWKPGFYKPRIKPKEAFRRLIRQALVAQLGKENVVDVDWKPTTDSLGRDALRITVVITPGATERLKNSVLDALIKLRERLEEMHDDRLPIVHYATEAELAEDASS
jgi:hypothetical protein